ncbi:hypothetical protein OG736_01945 [Streptomyces sp. NBC_01334]|nr:hypothetical protein OG736_01945 [Streptomyces sp. NBC_01334]
MQAQRGVPEGVPEEADVAAAAQHGLGEQPERQVDGGRGLAEGLVRLPKQPMPAALRHVHRDLHHVGELPYSGVVFGPQSAVERRGEDHPFPAEVTAEGTGERRGQQGVQGDPGGPGGVQKLPGLPGGEVEGFLVVAVTQRRGPGGTAGQQAPGAVLP